MSVEMCPSCCGIMPNRDVEYESTEWIRCPRCLHEDLGRDHDPMEGYNQATCLGCGNQFRFEMTVTEFYKSPNCDPDQVLDPPVLNWKKGLPQSASENKYIFSWSWMHLGVTPVWHCETAQWSESQECYVNAALHPFNTPPDCHALINEPKGK